MLRGSWEAHLGYLFELNLYKGRRPYSQKSVIDELEKLGLKSEVSDEADCVVFNQVG